MQREDLPLVAPPSPDRGLIVTVTPNPSFDRTLYLPSLRLDALNRAERVTLLASGKGVNVARALASRGVPTRCLGVVAGDAGRALQAHLNREGLPVDFVEIAEGETRSNITLVIASRRSETKINEPGPVVTEQALEQLAGKVTEVARRAFAVVFSGSLPPGAPPSTYARLIQLAREDGALAVLDAEGEPLRLGLAARPFLIKPNRHEAEQLVGRELPSVASAAQAAVALAGDGTNVLLTLGGQGAILATRDGCWRVSPPRLRAQNAVGAGDAFLAGFLAGLYQGAGAAEALQQAVTAAIDHLVGSATPISAKPRIRKLYHAVQKA